jgi:hypothetical protein
VLQLIQDLGLHICSQRRLRVLRDHLGLSAPWGSEVVLQGLLPHLKGCCRTFKVVAVQGEGRLRLHGQEQLQLLLRLLKVPLLQLAGVLPAGSGGRGAAEVWAPVAAAAPIMHDRARVGQALKERSSSSEQQAWGRRLVRGMLKITSWGRTTAGQGL